ncbi:3'-5' exonuclease [Vibrio sp. HB161653]|uniref:3'-5' exonuclease n=1 Tax=Vibrio sp. HB161653 TaxID=3068274 RepID=UPI003530B198
MIPSFFKPPMVQWPLKFEQKLMRTQSPMLRAFYQTPLPNATTPLAEVPFVALDFETTGLDPRKDDIITIGLVPFDLNRIYLNQARHWTLRPSRNLDEKSIVIHGITHSDIQDAPDLIEVLPTLLNALAGKITVVHYRRIEREFLNNAVKNRIGEGIEFPVLDTLDIEQRIQEKLTGGLWNQLKGKKPASVRLGQSRQRYGLPYYSPHHALTDAIATAELLQAQIAHFYKAAKPVGELWR